MFINIALTPESKMYFNIMAKIFIFLFAVAFSVCGAEDVSAIRKFPDGFLFGAATASYQIEGAWNEDGKSENIWDHLTHTQPCAVKDCSNGDIADDSYNQIERDVEMMRELGLDFYRFSLSWTRILPTSFPDKINQAGIDYYNRLIDEMLKYNIQPMVTLYHWDMPQKLQEMGGFTNPYIADWYGDYARVAFAAFGDRVRYWITMNEPKEICLNGYSAATAAPLINITGYAEYLCSKNLLLAHARAFHIYDEEFRASQGGIIGITLSSRWYEPESEEHIDAAEDFFQFDIGVYANPIFSKDGNFPQVMIERIAKNSKAEGFARSRLSEFTPAEVEYVKGTSDFYGQNHYLTQIVFRNESVDGLYPIPSYYNDIYADRYQLDNWPASPVSNLNRIVPWGFYKLLTKVRNDYNNPMVLITENGFPTRAGLDDYARATYYIEYLGAVLDAIDEGSDIRAYTAWSLMDNFEWLEGYTQRYGLYEVDYESPSRTRTPRRSAFVYKQILRTRTLDPHYQPDTTVMTIDEGH